MLIAAASALALALLLAAGGLASAEPAASPYQQMREGTPLEMIACGDGKVLLQKVGRPACVTPATAERLEARGWEAVVRAAEPDGAAEQQPSAARSDGTTPPQPDADPPADGGDAAVHDPLYLVAGGKISLEGVEKRLPNPTGVWLPVTREKAESEVMPRLAGGIGDTLILPAVDVTEYSYENHPLYMYDTEQGNVFKALGVNGHPDVITEIWYFVYGHEPIDGSKRLGYEAEAALLDGHYGFLRSLMENAGFGVSEVTGGPTDFGVYSDANPAMDVILWEGGRGGNLKLHFRGWASQEPPDGYILPETELERRASDFVDRHMDVFNDRCIFKKHNVNYIDIRYPQIIAGVPTYAAQVGYCIDVKYPDSRNFYQSVIIEATEGEIMWFADNGYLVSDWLDRLDIPESAKVRHGG